MTDHCNLEANDGHRIQAISVCRRASSSAPADLPRRCVDTQRHRVAIVGGGPVGLAVALGLANHGIRSVLLEADDSVCHGSGAICISRRSLEIIERLGALDDFLRVGLP